MSRRTTAPLKTAPPPRGWAPIALAKASPLSHHFGERLSNKHYNQCIDGLTAGPPLRFEPEAQNRIALLYTAEERRRRDASPWTIVQAVLAPVQFLIFLISLVFVLRYLASGSGLALATGSVVVKTVALYAIMITGSIWEREVFGRYLFARPFFWEDVFSILVLALHTLYLAALATGALTPRQLMFLVLAAYAAYVVNATQFLLKLRAARRQMTATGTLRLAS